MVFYLILIKHKGCRMLLSRYFFKTFKEIPGDADLKSHQLLVKGGYIKQVGTGIFSYFPIAYRSLKKIENIIREEMDRIDGYEVNLPVVMPASLWSETGRYEAVGSEMVRFDDRAGRKMVLGMTHEEAVTDLARYVINSYKQLPVMLYQIQTKFRDEPRSRGGLIRVREFVMKDAYSFHATYEDLDAYYEKVHEAYHRIYKRCGLDVISVASDVGMMGGTGAHEFMAVTESGEDTLIVCSSCTYQANREIAKAKRFYKKEPLVEMEEVETPGMKTIEEVAHFLGVETQDTLKAVIYKNEKEIILCVIRGDLEINEIKLKNYLGIKDLVFAEEDEIIKAGMVPGFASPVGLEKVRIIVDESAAESSNLVSGGNKKDVHIKNVNFKRDYTSKEIVDISTVKEGEICPVCGKQLKVTRGIEVGNIFKLGTKYSKAMKAAFLNEKGKAEDLIMGCYGIGVGRLFASVVETQKEENRIIWPISIAPFEVELIGLALNKNEHVKKEAFAIYKELKASGIDVLFDDRNSSPGFKFKDADLIGAPIRITIGDRSLKNGGVEIQRGNEEKYIVSSEKLISELSGIRKRLFDTLNS